MQWKNRIVVDGVKRQAGTSVDNLEQIAAPQSAGWDGRLVV
ncbi:MAG: hypothetical protein OQL27_00550 [Sedimenticola sp.]|nr:hypothetical protein [Sedimenticola sp.]